MLEKFLSKPIELNINNKTIRFSTIDDFEFSLDARTCISPNRIMDMMSASSAELNDEVKSIAVAKDELGRIVSQAPDTSGGITIRLKTIDTSIFSKEHNWRDIFIALNGYDSFNLSRHKNIALKLYLQYLRNRCGIASSIKKEIEKRKGIKPQEKHNHISDNVPNHLSTLEVNTEDLNSDLIMSRIPKAKSVSFEISAGDTVDIFIAGYECKIISDNGIKFIDPDKNTHSLKIGESKIGRDKGCDIKINESMREISRLHLLIINDGNKVIKLVDVSVRGTYLPKNISLSKG